MSREHREGNNKVQSLEVGNWKNEGGFSNDRSAKLKQKKECSV